jgi:hypothetical protein
MALKLDILLETFLFEVLNNSRSFGTPPPAVFGRAWS